MTEADAEVVLGKIAGPTEMDELLVRLERWLKRYRRGFMSTLLPGRTPRQLAVLEKTLGVTLPDDFKALYAWRGGQGGDRNDAFELHYTDFLPASAIVFNWKIFKKVHKEHEEAGWNTRSIETWNDKWIPFLDFGTGDVMCLDLHGSFGGTPGQVIHLSHDAGPFVILHSSVRAWLRTLVLALESTSQPWQKMRDTDSLPEIDTWTERVDPGYPQIVDG